MVKVRHYTDDLKQMKYEYTQTFKRVYSIEKFERFSDNIIKDTFKDYTYFQFDSARIYLKNNLLTGIERKSISALFEYGILTPTIIFCALDSLCRPFKDSSAQMITEGKTRYFSGKYRVSDSTYSFAEYGWNGLQINISDIEELKYLNKKNTRVYKLEQRFYKGHWNDAFFLFEITNDSANSKTSSTDFVKGGRLTFIKHTWTAGQI
jgi:hypothetical protein